MKTLYCQVLAAVRMSLIQEDIVMLFSGNNVLLVGVWGPESPCEEVNVKHMGRNIYNVDYRLKQRGDYVITKASK